MNKDCVDLARHSPEYIKGVNNFVIMTFSKDVMLEGVFCVLVLNAKVIIGNLGI